MTGGAETQIQSRISQGPLCTEGATKAWISCEHVKRCGTVDLHHQNKTKTNQNQTKNQKTTTINREFGGLLVY